MGNMTRTKSTSSGSDLTCPHCSPTVDETTNSIGCDKCGCWVHHTCTKIPTEALTYMSTEGVFWFCNDCTKAVKKLVIEDNHRDGIQGRHKQQSTGNQIDTVRLES